MTRIFVPMICKKMPRDVRGIRDKNKTMCSNHVNSVDLWYSNPIFTAKTALFAGLEMEKRKAEILLSHDDIMVIDWDVELLGFDDTLPPGLYVGSWPKTNNVDGFLIYKKGNQHNRIIENFLSRPPEYWQSYLGTITDDVIRYPKNLYIHYNFGFGQSVRCVDSIDDKTIDKITSGKILQWQT